MATLASSDFSCLNSSNSKLAIYDLPDRRNNLLSSNFDLPHKQEIGRKKKRSCRFRCVLTDKLPITHEKVETPRGSNGNGSRWLAMPRLLVHIFSCTLNFVYQGFDAHLKDLKLQGWAKERAPSWRNWARTLRNYLIGVSIDRLLCLAPLGGRSF